MPRQGCITSMFMIQSEQLIISIFLLAEESLQHVADNHHAYRGEHETKTSKMWKMQLQHHTWSAASCQAPKTGTLQG